jgi:hypothetical protein
MNIDFKKVFANYYSNNQLFSFPKILKTLSYISLEIFNANDYAKESDFSSEIYERVFRELGEEN